MKATKFAPADVKKIAQLANIPVTSAEEKKLASGFNTTLAVVDQLFAVDVKNNEPTHQVTGLENIFREDEIDVERTFAQEAALANAPRTYNGFFVVDQVIEQEE